MSWLQSFLNEATIGKSDSREIRMRAYPAKFVEAEEGGYVVTFRDVPEAITEGDTLEAAFAHAADALETALSFYIGDRLPLPAPSAPERGERMVNLSGHGL
jgi:antitoxin HicB